MISGQNVYMNDATGGAWYVLNNTLNGLPDADGRVLFMQVTTAGEISGTINLQIFENGVGSESIYNTYDFAGTGIRWGGTTSNACGCRLDADNYDDAAEYDDGSCEYAVPVVPTRRLVTTMTTRLRTTACTYADTGYDCEGNCWRMPTATVYVTNLKWLDVPTQLPVTMTLMLPMTTAAVPNSTSAAAAVTASPKVRDCEGNGPEPATTAMATAWRCRRRWRV